MLSPLAISIIHALQIGYLFDTRSVLYKNVRNVLNLIYLCQPIGGFFHNSANEKEENKSGLRRPDRKVRQRQKKEVAAAAGQLAPFLAAFRPPPRSTAVRLQPLSLRMVCRSAVTQRTGPVI
jgi:hypothetical protein